MTYVDFLENYKLFIEKHGFCHEAIIGMSNEEIEKLEIDFRFKFSHEVKMFLRVFGKKSNFKYIPNRYFIQFNRVYNVYSLLNEYEEDKEDDEDDLITMTIVYEKIAELCPSFEGRNILFIWIDNDLEYFIFIVENDVKCNVYIWNESGEKIHKAGDIISIFRSIFYKSIIEMQDHLNGTGVIESFFQLSWIRDLLKLRKIYGKHNVGALRYEYDERESVTKDHYESIEEYEKGFLGYLSENNMKLPVG